MFSTIRLIAAGASTLGTIKSLVDSCSQHFFYRGMDDNIYELCWRQTGWTIANITKTCTGTKAPKAITNPAGYSASSGAEYLYYFGEDNHIYQLYRYSVDGTQKTQRWEINDISYALKEKNLRPQGDLTVWTLLGTEHIFFTTTNGHVHQMFRIHDLPYVPKTGWKHRNLTLQSFSPLNEICWLEDGQPPADEVTFKEIWDEEIEDKAELLYPDLFINVPEQKKKPFDLMTYRKNAQDMEHEMANLRDRIAQVEKGEIEASAETLKRNLNKISSDRRKVIIRIRRHLLSVGIITGSVAGNVGLGGVAQYLYYYSRDGSLYQMRWGTGFWIKESDLNLTGPLENEQDEKENLDDSAALPRKSSKPKGWASWLYTGALNTVSSIVSAPTALSTLPQWTTTNLSEFTNCSDSLFINTPVSHTTSIGSQHVFFVEYVMGHVHELYWSPASGRWKHKDMTMIAQAAPIDPTTQLVSMASSTYHFVYFIDEDGNLHEFSQKIIPKEAKWRSSMINTTVPDLPLAKRLLSCSTFPLNKEMNSSVIYYLDQMDHLIELGCHWQMSNMEWRWTDLHLEKKLQDEIQVPMGKVCVYTRGLVETFSTSAQSSISSAYDFVRQWVYPKPNSQLEEEENLDEIQQKERIRAAERLQKQLEDETLKRNLQIELNMKLQEEILKLQQSQEEMFFQQRLKLKEEAEFKIQSEKQMAELQELQSKMQKNLQQHEESELKIREFQLEITRRDEEALSLKEEVAKQRKLEKELHDTQAQVLTLTTGLGYDTFIKVHQKKAKDQSMIVEKECAICLEERPLGTMQPCMHQLCEDCNDDLRQKICPICGSIITHFSSSVK